MKNIKVYIHNINNKNYRNFNLKINNLDTINNVKNNISLEINTFKENIRLYPKKDKKIITGYSYYGLQGDISFLENYSEFDEFIVFEIK